MSQAQIQIFDTTLRDGEQVPMQTQYRTKLIIAEQFSILALMWIEAGFPISSPGDFKSVEAIAKLIKKGNGLRAYPCRKKDIEVAGSFKVREIPTNPHRNWHLRFVHQIKFNSTREQILERAYEAVSYAKSFVEDVEFYAEDAGRTDNEYLARVLWSCHQSRCHGFEHSWYHRLLPSQWIWCQNEVFDGERKGHRKGYPFLSLPQWFGIGHSQLHWRVINGARQIECTINGVGERAGNTALEEVVMILRQHPYLNLDTSINTKEIYSTSQLVSQHMGVYTQPNKALGSNAFAHSSESIKTGHQEKGNLRNHRPKEVGVTESVIVLTARSGQQPWPIGQRK